MRARTYYFRFCSFDWLAFRVLNSRTKVHRLADGAILCERCTRWDLWEFLGVKWTGFAAFRTALQINVSLVRTTNTRLLIVSSRPKARTSGFGCCSSSMSALMPKQSLSSTNSFLNTVLSFPARVRYSTAVSHSACVGRTSRANAWR